MSIPIYQDRQTLSAQYRQWLMGGDRGCIVRDLETIIVLVLLAFNFIPQRSHHAFTLTRSRFRDSATVTRAPGDGTTAIKVESSSYPISLFSRMEKVPRCPKHGPKTLPCCTPETTLTSLLRHPSTKTNCDQLDKNCVSTDNTEPPIPTELTLLRIP